MAGRPPDSISVIIPARNAAASLDACLRAVLAQSWGREHPEQFEVIVVNDGSTDDTALQARRYPVQLLSQAHAGPAAARNRGAQVARGEALAFTDADCEPVPEWLAELAASLSDESVAGVKGIYATRQKGRVARLAQLEFEERYERLERASQIDFVETHSAAFRASEFRAAGGFDPFFTAANNEDVDLAYRLAARGCRMVLNRSAIVYHQHVDSLAAYFRVKFWRGYWRMQVYRRYPNKMMADSYTPPTLKISSMLAPLALPLLLLVPFQPWALLPLALLVLAIAALSANLLRLAGARDRGLQLMVPLFALTRALGLGLGSLWGVASIMRRMILSGRSAHDHPRLSS